MRTGCILAAKNRISKIRRKDLGVQQVSTLRKVRQKQIQNMFLYAKSSDSFWRYLRQIKSTNGDISLHQDLILVHGVKCLKM